MAPANKLFSLFLTSRGPTVKAMQEVLHQIGEATTGTKDVVQTRLLTKATATKFPSFGLEKTRATRILSIDMGIKNLAYCVADVQLSTPTLGAAKMDILNWRRIDLSEAFRETTAMTPPDMAEDAALDGSEDEDLYSPANLSLMADRWLEKVTSEHHPDIILIERQRWRSSSSPTIQQWTVRVNTLEAIMWALLTASRMNIRLPGEKRERWWIFAVDPKRVGHFWLDGETSSPTQKGKKKAVRTDVMDEDEATTNIIADEPKKVNKGKAEKKAKIQLLRAWLNSENPSTTPSARTKSASTKDGIANHPNISFSFSPTPRNPHRSGYDSDATRQALLYATDSPSERSKRENYLKTYTNKVDDLTDCFLQAAAWVAWEENARRLKPQVDELRQELEERLGKKPSLGQQLVEAVKELKGGSMKVANEGASDEKGTKSVPKKASARKTKSRKVPSE